MKIMTYTVRFFRSTAALALLGSLFLNASSVRAQMRPQGNHIVRTGEPEATFIHSHGDFDKCGPIDEKAIQEWRLLAGDQWGYGYDSLLIHLEEWKQSPYVTASVIGQSVEGRDIHALTITSDQPPQQPRHTVSIHARTHPMETQSTWVCNEMIRFLLSDNPYAAFLRERCTFHIVPMYNPDGVEATSTRYNAHGVDLEREWNKANPEPEAAALKAHFARLMNSEAPIEIALNLHSSSDPNRYFWYHHETGTSMEFTHLQQEFIDDVRRDYSGIMPFYYRVSWINETPVHFPESWFWLNYGTNVMALTYEDIYERKLDHPQGNFDSTAWALLRGVGSYLDLQMPSSVADRRDGNGLELTVFNGTPTRISLTLPAREQVVLTVHDAMGREVARPAERMLDAGTHELYWSSEGFPSGAYFVRVQSGTAATVSRVVIAR